MWKRRAVGLLIFGGSEKRKGEDGRSVCVCAVSFGEKCPDCHDACALGGGKRGISHYDRSADERKLGHVFVSAWGLEVPLYCLFFCALLVLMKSGRVCAKTGDFSAKAVRFFPQQPVFLECRGAECHVSRRMAREEGRLPAEQGGHLEGWRQRSSDSAPNARVRAR